MQPTFISATTTYVSQTAPNLSGGSPLSSFFEGSDIGNFLSFQTVLHWLDIIWSTYALVAYLACIFMLILYVYAATRYKQLLELREEMVAERERIYDERFRSGPKNDRLKDVETHITSDRPNDWKLAIIEADIILDEALKKAGYAGASLGDRLKSISPSQLNSLDAAWQAHKVRNQIAHGGEDFVLTKRLAEDTIKQYRMVFVDLGVL